MDCKKSLAGRLKHKITIQQLTETRDSYGGLVNTWATFATMRAAITPLSGGEFYQAKQEFSSSILKFKIRYKAGIQTKMRILYDSRYFDIESIIDINMEHKVIDLMCTENVS